LGKHQNSFEQHFCALLIRVSRDEILYNAKIHPEQYTNALSDAQLNQLHESILGVCSVAVETLADQEKFPEEWLMRHRWSKGKKDKNKLPNGQKIEFVKVGGRTSAFVPTVQKITGSAADEATDNTERAVEMDDRDSLSSDQDIKKKSKPLKKRAAAPKAKVSALKRKSDGVEDDDKGGSEEEEELAKPVPKKPKASIVDERSKGSSEKKPSKQATKSSSAANDNKGTRKRSSGLRKWMNGGG
jgi:formamidopyrimidine-DNA glycosylase